MRKVVLALYLGFFVVFALAGCGNTSTSGGPSGALRLPLPRGTPQQPVGTKAITPGPEGITKDDVTRYVTTHNMPFNIGTLKDITGVQVELLTSEQVNARLHRQNTHIPASYPLYFVTLTGRFTFPEPPSLDGKAASVTYTRAFEVFDAKTGNLLMGGGLNG